MKFIKDDSTNKRNYRSICENIMQDRKGFIAQYACMYVRGMENIFR